MKKQQFTIPIFQQCHGKGILPILKKSRIGTHPILLVVVCEKLQQAAHWGKVLHQQYNVHTLTTNELNEIVIHAYFQQHIIQSVVILELKPTLESVHIATSQNSLRHFLKLYPLPTSVTVDAAPPDQLSTHPLVTQFSIGALSNTLHKEISFFFSMFLPLHIRLAEHKGTTQKVCYSSSSAGAPMPLNKVALHPEDLQEFGLIENEYVIIINPAIDDFAIAITSSSEKVERHTIRSSLGIRNKLQLINAGEILMHPLKKIEVNHITVQKITHLQDESIFLSTDLYKQFEYYAASHYELVNPLTAASYDLSRKRIKVDTQLKPQTMRINYLMREFLDYEQPPATISDFYLRYIECGNCTETQKKLIQKKYTKNICDDALSYDDKLALKSILKSAGLWQLDLYPLPKREKEPTKRLYKKLIQHYMKWTIRPAKIKLKVIRPYSTDESSNIVRMTKNSMSLLGIAENDLVTLSYRGKSVSVPVLELSSSEWIRETNIMPNDSNMNISIGIPASLRLQLGMKKIGVVCTVKRNLPYLFKKNQNLQFIPIVATLLAIYAVNFLDTWVKIVLILIFVPLANYISLSDVREKIPKL